MIYCHRLDITLKLKNMKKIISIISVVVLSFSANAQSKAVTNDPSLVQVVEVSCGQCNFGLTDKKGCDLAVRMDGKAYWVTGTDIHSHGDAHGENGFCSTVRKAEIAGEIVDGKFNVSHFKLLPVTSTKKGHEGHNHD